MALFESTTRSHFGGLSLRGRLSATFANIVSALMAWNDERATRKSLANLTDRELDDIGLVRGDIDTIARRFMR